MCGVRALARRRILNVAHIAGLCLLGDHGPTRSRGPSEFVRRARPGEIYQKYLISSRNSTGRRFPLSDRPVHHLSRRHRGVPCRHRPRNRAHSSLGLARVLAPVQATSGGTVILQYPTVP